MHDLDRTTLEAGFQEYAPEIFETGFNPEMAGFEFAQETPLFEIFQEAGIPLQETYEVPLADHEVMELATKLMGITNDQELNYFLGDVFKKVGSAIGSFVKSPVGKALGGILKTVAKKALPIAGGALGGLIGGPAGAAIGSKLAPMAGSLFGLELAGLSPEDRDFEVSRRFVKFAANAVKRATAAPLAADPLNVAKSAVTAAARIFAPGLLTPGLIGATVPPATYFPTPIPSTTAPCTCGADAYGPGITGHSGRWVRRGNKIILFGA
jgi:hypothetical protein